MGHAKDQTGPDTEPAGTRFEIVFPGDQMALRQALKEAMTFLRGLPISQDACGLVEIILAEAINNVIEHAYADDCHGIVEFRIEYHGEKLRILILDDGLPMPGGVVPSGPAPSLAGPRDDLPEGGFGWHMIQELTQELHYMRIGNRNRLELSIRPGALV